MKKLKEMTWGLILGHLGFFLFGIFILIVVAIYQDKKTEEETGAFILTLALGVSVTINSIVSFLSCLFGKEEGKYHPYMSQEEKDRMTTSNKKSHLDI